MKISFFMSLEYHINKSEVAILQLRFFEYNIIEL